jgi:NAD(P)H-flavin reductase
MAATATAEPALRGAMTPAPYRVVSRAPETADTWTLLLEPLAEPVVPQPGQFDMLYAFGVGEVPISTSAAPDPNGVLVHTIRDVGPVTHALVSSTAETVVGVRGPFGTTWPLELARGRDLVIVAGGIGLAPLRPAVYHALTHRDDFGSVCVLVGARTPQDLLFVRELEDWRGRFDVDLDVTVDSARGDWRGRVGVVTQLVPRAPFDAENAVALVCGPELMMTFAARSLLARGMSKEAIYVSMERNMRCGLGHCGHCQLGPVLICRDGPVFRFDEMEQLMEVREL